MTNAIKKTVHKNNLNLASPRQKEIMKDWNIEYTKDTTYDQAYKIIADRIKKELADSRIKTHPIIDAFLKS